MNWRIGIGGRLLFAFSLLATMTLIATGLSFRSHAELESRLSDLHQKHIGALFAATQLNDQSRQIVSQASALSMAERQSEREQVKDELLDTLNHMEDWMRQLPDKQRYFLELNTQIRQTIMVLYKVTTQRATFAASALQHSQKLNETFEDWRQTLTPSNITSQLWYLELAFLAGYVEKVSAAQSFNELDYTFLRIEEISQHIAESAAKDKTLLQDKYQQLLSLLAKISREGPMFHDKNQELDLSYQQSFLVLNNQRHVQQLARQISYYSHEINQLIDNELSAATQSVAQASRLTLGLSLLSLIMVITLSWLYVRRNILNRIRTLQANMQAIANGHLNTPIVISGNDEISGMAQDLAFFQQSALLAEQTHRQLQSEMDERHQAEQQLMQTQRELVQAGKLAALGQLSVSITHEINQPLAAMRNYIFSLEHYLQQNNVPQVRRKIEQVGELLDKVNNITHNLKSFARKADNDLSPVHLHTVINAAVELLQVDNKGIKLQVQPLCQNQSGQQIDTVWVAAEAIRLEQVLINLLSNAIDALHTVSEPEIVLTWRTLDHWVELLVIDNGCGIEPEHTERIFDPFFSLKSTTNGLGLGLSISYNIVQDLCGQLKLLNSYAGYTCFSLKLLHSIAPVAASH
ncbi:HAMP domain-containing protein [Limnobaculum zhutongyuii]|uniref:C4-dicarboxylate transport sensor protein DctB n=1 Tax=Limnobaculum zhutongyuii TaxID=2498113 RepID=A0A411WHR6_9GAMM|nr:ATP-binding protein [Limnobaculum zhutongyuii]QBH95594.1 HAMP domain-containing protein [Limnobaculum zhutongyuii]TQS88715.1 HAMP domain-containing protein [Limnobaculum zhutongyuii]